MPFLVRTAWTLSVYGVATKRKNLPFLSSQNSLFTMRHQIRSYVIDWHGQSVMEKRTRFTGKSISIHGELRMLVLIILKSSQFVSFDHALWQKFELGCEFRVSRWQTKFTEGYVGYLFGSFFTFGSNFHRWDLHDETCGALANLRWSIRKHRIGIWSCLDLVMGDRKCIFVGLLTEGIGPPNCVH